jgi:hypothetical protein
VCAGLECLDRTRFFAGQLLSEADLNNEQSYWMAKSRLHNRYLHGWGIVCGLQVTCSDCDGWVNINPGYALDPCGNDIIVCEGQSFNVLQAIQACCKPKQTSNCSPLRSSPAVNCQDLVQTWCITLEYKEQSSRMVTPLQQNTSKSGGCGCGGSSSNGCGCGGCGCGKQTSSSCSCATASTSTSTAASCQATRIVEGFQLGVCQAPAATNSPRGKAGSTNPYTPAATTSPWDQCTAAYSTLLAQKPDLQGDTAQVAYQTTCQYLTSARNALATMSSTDCQLGTTLAGIIVPAPGPNSGTDYIMTLQTIITQIAGSILTAELDCLCFSLLPQCPPAACDNRLVLACVTIQNGVIVDICHFGGGRKQLISFPAIGYWISLLDHGRIPGLVGEALGALCCGEVEKLGSLFASITPQADVLTTSPANPAFYNRAFFSSLGQMLGASAVNTAYPQAKAVDLRPLVGTDCDSAIKSLGGYGVPESTLDVKDVSADPSWTDTAVAASASFAPSAFIVIDPLTQVVNPLTLYTKGNVLVGVEAKNRFDVLSAQVANLQQQVAELQNPPINVAKPGSTATDSAKTAKKKK